MASEELVSERFYPVPAQTLYAAFADPVRLARWWGPHGAVNRFDRFELRPGGAWTFTMTGPWGELPMRKTFEVVEPGRRVVVHHRQEGHTFTLDMAYEPVRGGTRLVWRTRFATPQQLAVVRAAFAQANEQNFDRLAAEVGAGPAGRAGDGRGEGGRA